MNRTTTKNRYCAVVLPEGRLWPRLPFVFYKTARLQCLPAATAHEGLSVGDRLTSMAQDLLEGHILFTLLGRERRV